MARNRKRDRWPLRILIRGRQDKTSTSVRPRSRSTGRSALPAQSGQEAVNLLATGSQNTSVPTGLAARAPMSSHGPAVVNEDDVAQTVSDNEPDPKEYFTPGQDPFEKMSIDFREASVPQSLACFLVVELSDEKDSDERKFTTESLELEWQKPIRDHYELANRFAESKCDKHQAKASYLVSVGYTIHQQRSPHQKAELTRAEDTRKRLKADLQQTARLQAYEYHVHSTNTLTNPKHWEEAWDDQFPISVANALSEVGHAVYIIEIKFRYQVYSEHVPSSCNGGEECFEKVIKALDRQSANTWREEVSFIPTRFFGVYFTQKVVDHILSHCNDGKLEWDLPNLDADARIDFVNYISAFGVKLLATCIYAKIGLKRLYDLYKAGVQDVNLPLLKYGVRPLPERHYVIPDWPGNERNLFYDQQFQFCAHSFRRKQDDEKLLQIKDRMVMPFLEKDLIAGSPQGSYADVFCVKIHEQHHEFSNDRSQLFAVKTFKKQDGENFEQEKKICQVLASYPHDHLTPYLTAWEDVETFNILFPKAEMDLHSYLMETQSPDNIPQHLPWLLEQMLGLSEGLSSIHRIGTSHTTSSGGQNTTAEGRQRIVCHHDMKPSNILVFRESQGLVMKISDFGLAKIKERTSREVEDPASPRTRATGGTWEYMSPEKRLTRKSSRPSDVWSLGCIFLVMLLWFFGDEQNLVQFRAVRAEQATKEGDDKVYGALPWHEFWRLCRVPATKLQEADVKEDDPMKRVVLKDAVEAKFKWLKLSAELSKKGVLKDLVELVSLDMMRPDPVARKCAPAVCSELKNFCQRVERDIDDPGNRVSRILTTGASTVGAPTEAGEAQDVHQLNEISHASDVEPMFGESRLQSEQLLSNFGGHLYQTEADTSLQQRSSDLLLNST